MQEPSTRGSLAVVGEAKGEATGELSVPSQSGEKR